MADDHGTQRRSCEGQKNSKCDGKCRRGSFAQLLPWVTSFSLIAFVILVAAAFFQSQLTSLQKELAAIKMNLSSCIDYHEEKTKVLKKRSSTTEKGNIEEQTETGIQAAHLQGSIPFQHIQNNGRIGPWTISSTDDSLLRLLEGRTEVEVLQSGVYYVYAQVFYLTSKSHNSFQILSHNGTEMRKRHRIVVTCSLQGRNLVGESSCHTGLVVGLTSGERLYLNQVEQDRIIQFSNGCSYFGVVLLKKNSNLKQKRQSN